MTLELRLRELQASGCLNLPLPGHGATADRHRKLAELARLDLPLARLAEAHTDAVAILAEAGRTVQPGLYGVWAAETAGMPLRLNLAGHRSTLSGSKLFCSGAGLLDRALVTVEGRLLDVNLRASPHTIMLDQSAWKTCAFAETNTAAVTFANTPVSEYAVIGEDNWYVERPGLWHGACGPAACWAGGAIGLFDYALSQSRDDAHTMAHLAAMHADVWALWAYLDCAGFEIDRQPGDFNAARVRALTMRHLVEQACADMLRRLGRAYGPRALAYNAEVSNRYREVDLYIRQSHAERDLEMLGRRLREQTRSADAEIQG
jgi:hypothetical protein